MSKVTNLKQYRAAKKVIKDLESMVNIFSLSIKAMSLYTNYKVAQECLEVLKANKVILDSYYKKCKEILDDKVEKDSK
jgi:hypothetical protein